MSDTELPPLPSLGGLMDPVFDRNGDAVGWFHDSVLYDNFDHYRAVVVDGEVYQLGSSQFLGRLERGFIWDRNGMVVACLETATPPPELPDFQPYPAEVSLDLPEDRSVTQRAPSPSRLTERWSQRTWDRFLEGQ